MQQLTLRTGSARLLLSSSLHIVHHYSEHERVLHWLPHVLFPAKSTARPEREPIDARRSAAQKRFTLLVIACSSGPGADMVAEAWSVRKGVEVVVWDERSAVVQRAMDERSMWNGRRQKGGARVEERGGAEE